MRLVWCVLILCSSLAVAVDLPYSVRQALETIEREYEADKESDTALSRTFDAMKVANYYLGGGTLQTTTGQRPFENGDQLEKLAALRDLPPGMRIEAYKLLKRISDKVQATASAKTAKNPMAEDFRILHTVVDEQAARESEIKIAPEETVVGRNTRREAQPEANSRRLSDREHARAEKELDDLLAAHRDLLEVAREHLPVRERGEEEVWDGQRPVESVADRNKRIMGVINTVTALNSGQPLTPEQISIANNLNAHARGPVDSGNGSGGASSSNTAHEPRETFDQKLSAAMYDGDPRKAVALLKAEIARLNHALEAKKTELNDSDRKIIERAKSAAKKATIDRPRGFNFPEIRLPNLGIGRIMEAVLEGVDKLGQNLPKIPKISFPTIKLPEIKAPAWLTAKPEPERPIERPRYEPPRRSYYDEPSYGHRTGNSDGSGCGPALAVMGGVGVVGVGGLLTTGIVVSIYNDEAYIDDHRAPDETRLKSITDIVNGNGTWGTPEPRVQNRAVEQLGHMYLHRKTEVLDSVNESLRNRKWVMAHPKWSAEAYVEMLKRLFKDNPDDSDAIRAKIFSLISDNGLPLEFRKAIFPYATGSDYYRFRSFYSEREEWKKRKQEVLKAIATYEQTLLAPDKIRNPDDVRKWLREARFEYLPEAEEKLRNLHDPFTDYTETAQKTIKAFVTEMLKENPKEGYSLGYDAMGPKSFAWHLAIELKYDEAMKSKVNQDDDLKKAMREFLIEYDQADMAKDIFGY